MVLYASYDKRNLSRYLSEFTSQIAKSGLRDCKSVVAFENALAEGLSQAFFINELTRRAWIDTNKELIDAWEKASLEVDPELANQAMINLRSFLDYEDEDTKEISHVFKGVIGECLSCLEKNGVYVFKKRLPSRIIQGMKADFTESKLSSEGKGQNKNEHYRQREDCFQDADAASIRHFYDPQELNTSSALKKVALQYDLHKIASFYFKNRPYLLTAGGWLSVGKANSKSQDFSNAAQEFHFDFDALKFLKVFIYLSDVSVQSGAHQLFKSSVGKFPLGKPQLEKMPTYFRASQQALETVYGADDLLTLEGAAGTVVIEDTSCFHRGCPMSQGQFRDIVQFEFKDCNLADLLPDGNSQGVQFF